MAFTPEVYERIREGAQRSAARIVPLVYDLVKPDLVADVGCGSGEFARAFAREGCHVAALDESVEAGGRRESIGAHGAVRFSPVDLSANGWWLPVDGADLAVCLEVAEHLPESAAPGLVEGLTDLAPVVLFSAAIPGQTGHGHVNLAWPDAWAELFADYGYLAYEDLRWRIWGDGEIEPWYRQNLLLFANERLQAEMPVEFVETPRSVVHPDIWAWKLG